MNILLVAVNAKYIHSNLAVYSLRAFAGEYKENIQIKEYTINQRSDEILKDIWKARPDILFFSCYIWNISFVKELIGDLRKILPHVPIWVGGPEVSYDGVRFLEKNPHIRGVIKGEGEATFYSLLHVYSGKGGSLKSIPGIAFYSDADENGQILDNPSGERLDMNQIPFPYEDLENFDHRIIYYESSRGCPFSCSYCLSSVDKKLRFRDLQLVKGELQLFIDRRVPQVKFVDRTFNCSHTHAMEIWKFLIKQDNGVTNFHFEVAADLLTQEEISLIRTMRPGLIQLEIGVQSTNQETLKAIGRTMDFEKVCAAVGRIQEPGNVHQHLDLIAGLPKEDYDSFRQSFNQVYALQPEQLQLGFLKVLKGSYMYERAEAYGCIYKEKEPYEVLFTRWLSYGEVLQLKQVESMVEVYYNSRQFQHTIAEVLGFFDSPFGFYEALGKFYEEQGYDEISHSRLQRYEILLEFMGVIPEADLENVKEQMTWDLYLRENLKSRPQWMSDQSRWQPQIREYIRNHQLPKTSHIEVFRQGAVLFNYEMRNPLTNNTRGVPISFLEIW